MENNTVQVEARVQKLESLAHRPVPVPGGSGLVSGAATIVWRPGTASAGNVYATWAEVVTAVAALQGAIAVVVDMDTAPAVIPAGAWDLRPAGTSGPVTLVAGGNNTPYFSQFVTIANAVVTIHGLTGLDGIQIVNQSTADVITISAALEQEEFTMRGYAAIYQSVLAGAANAFIQVNNFSGALSLYDASFVSSLDAGTNAVQVAGAGFLQLYIHGTSCFDVNQLVAGALTALVIATGQPTVGFPMYGAQAGAPTIIPTGVVQKGTAAILVGTGKTAAIPAFISATSVILVSQNTPGAGANDAATVKYAALGADRVVGALGSFQITAILAAGGGAVNGADTSTIDWEVLT